MKPWRIHPEAQAEIDEVLEHYLFIDGELAVSFDLHFSQARQQICGNPLLFNIRAGRSRRVNLKPRFGEYYIAYMIWKDQVIILAIAHAKRRPYYWRRRIVEAKKIF